MILIMESIITIAILIAGSIISASPEAEPDMIYIMGIIAGTWMTKWLQDLKEWRGNK